MLNLSIEQLKELRAKVSPKLYVGEDDVTAMLYALDLLDEVIELREWQKAYRYHFNVHNELIENGMMVQAHGVDTNTGVRYDSGLKLTDGIMAADLITLPVTVETVVCDLIKRMLGDVGDAAHLTAEQK